MEKNLRIMTGDSDELSILIPELACLYSMCQFREQKSVTKDVLEVLFAAITAEIDAAYKEKCSLCYEDDKECFIIIVTLTEKEDKVEYRIERICENCADSQDEDSYLTVEEFGGMVTALEETFSISQESIN